MNEDVRLVVKLASECIDFEETILSKYAYSNVIRLPGELPLFRLLSSLFFLFFFFSFSPFFHSSSRPFLSFFSFFFASLRCILRSLSLFSLLPFTLISHANHTPLGGRLPRKFTAVLIPRSAEVLSETKAQGRLESAKKRGFFLLFRLRIGQPSTQTIIS